VGTLVAAVLAVPAPAATVVSLGAVLGFVASIRGGRRPVPVDLLLLRLLGACAVAAYVGDGEPTAGRAILLALALVYSLWAVARFRAASSDLSERWRHR
jgi:hypothetical protein